MKKLLIIGGVIIALILAVILNRKTENTKLTKSKYVFGIDISHYQGNINWRKVAGTHHPIKFVYIRSTMGINGKDKRYAANYRNAKKQGFLVGAYHYYRPNENSTRQFNNFAATVKLRKGDLPPVLDIELIGRQSRASIVKGVLNWLRLAQRKYGVKPVLYTGRHFYDKYLKGRGGNYYLWISSFSSKHKIKHHDWTFHQFTDKVRVTGIRSTVDGNDFNGTLEELKGICVR
jgi:GH25 family lysozyme M1 (1,4-beta-N-acetylmuramidase)